MRDISRRTLLSATALGALGAAGCSAPRTGKPPPGPAPEARLIGDGSTSDTGPQPNQPVVDTLDRTKAPPQFVIISWDGAGELSDGLFARFLEVARRNGAWMTFFLSGLYFLPEHRKNLYRPPGHPVGASDIAYLSEESVHRTIRHIDLAWRAGHEIGTHFNGHFCGPRGVRLWGAADWASEIEQAVRFVMNWKTNTGFTDLPPLPFDYRRELVGARTPCLLGQDNLLPTAAKLGWKYDASSPGGLQVWPRRRGGLWDFPLQSIPMPGSGFEVLSMDYNIMFNQSETSTKDKSRHRAWGGQALGTYLAGFERSYSGNRAPLFVGNHFERWNGGIYMDAVERFMDGVGGERDVRMVSFRQFTDWINAQDPAVVERLATLGVGQRPEQGWAEFLAPSEAEGAAVPVS
ncbi:hypothetical protein [Actinorugispora endophytica]|uniref:hypothetical protein n=1 Tax=Actinorugispora endophytica TaxID=1605990 RepID=UPI00105D10C6|nr:hypothetical protein [Actinorugispora endophytica]